jgi:ADP-heptose:LPS heptosyltransferase
LIHDITESIKFPLILVGSIDDVSLYSKLGYNKSVYNGLGEFSLNEVLYLLENSNFCIAPDSSIMHLASITNTKIIGIMGNALEQTFGPLFSINKFILSRNASCSPCSKSVCHKYDGHSCVQDISLSEIINYI